MQPNSRELSLTLPKIVGRVWDENFVARNYVGRTVLDRRTENGK